jgi:sigma-B regulation protein RsbU (phosphoserine phosphatase)
VTDGATEAVSPGDEEFGEDRLRALIESASGLSAEAVVRRVSERVREWAGPAGCSDDLTLMVLKAV